MADPADLTLAYLAAHPDDAARLLETLPLPASAALLGGVPARIGAAVLAAMRAPAAAQHVLAQDGATADALLAAASLQAAASVLRHVAEPDRSRLLDGLPAATAVACRMILGYPEDAVAAWTDTDVVALAPETRAGEARARVREGPEDVADILYTVTPAGVLAGVIGIGALLRAPDHLPVGALARPAPATLPAAMPLGAAAAVRAWDRAASLPVVEHSERLIGTLRRSALSRALARGRDRAVASGGATVAGALAGAYWTALSGLVAATVALLPPARPPGARRP